MEITQAKRTALGKRLRSIREQKEYTQQEIADHLTARGLECKKAAVSQWEIGKNTPNPFVLMVLANLYRVSVDALLWDDAISTEALELATKFDALKDSDRRTLKALCEAYFQQSDSNRGNR